MSTLEDFAIGDRVAHISLGDGAVIQVGENVHVQFDRLASKGRHIIGIYDRAWFQMHPNSLFHRTSK